MQSSENYNLLMKMIYKSAHYVNNTDGSEFLKYIANIDPNFVYSKHTKETILGLLIWGYGTYNFITPEMIDDLIDRTDPSLFTPQIDYGVNKGCYNYIKELDCCVKFNRPLSDILYWCIYYDYDYEIDNNVYTVNTRCLAIARKLISKMDFSLPGSSKIVLYMISKKPKNRDLYDTGLVSLLIPDLIIKGAIIYSDILRIDNKDNEAIGVDLLYLCNKVNVQENHIILDNLLAFV